MVPTGNLIMMAINALLGFAIPVFLCWWAVKKHQAKLSTILIGAGTFIVFALVLESIVHQIVLKGPSGAIIQGKTLYYALYGGLMAGLFEETGRFLAMKFLLKKEPTETKPGVSYGLGHGGVEMVIVFGISMISTLTMAIMVNLGQTDTLLSSAPAEAQDQLAVILSKSTGMVAVELIVMALAIAVAALAWMVARRAFPAKAAAATE